MPHYVVDIFYFFSNKSLKTEIEIRLFFWLDLYSPSQSRSEKFLYMKTPTYFLDFSLLKKMEESPAPLHVSKRIVF